MAKMVCPVCTQRKGKRFCKKNNQTICSICCPELRNEECAGCPHYAAAAAYEANKVKRLPSAERARKSHFVIELNEEVEKEVNHALALSERGKRSEAKGILKDLAREHPRNHMVHFGLGVVAAQEERYEEALAHFERATEIFPLFTAALYNKAASQLKLGDFTGYIRSLEATVSTDGDDDIIDMAEERLQELDRVIRKDRGISLDAYLEGADLFALAYSHMENRQWSKAIELFKRVLEIDATHVPSWGNLGLAHGVRGDKEKALACLDRATELDPKYQPAILNRKTIQSLKEGEVLDAPVATVEYYKYLHER